MQVQGKRDQWFIATKDTVSNMLRASFLTCPGPSGDRTPTGGVPSGRVKCLLYLTSYIHVPMVAYEKITVRCQGFSVKAISA